MRDDNKVTIHYWAPVPTDGQKCGHMSLQTSQIYASFWPNEENESPNFRSAYRGGGMLVTSLQADISKYARYGRDNGVPDAKITINGLAIKEINTKFNQFKNSINNGDYDWGLLTTGRLSQILYGRKDTQNCSGLVFLLLKAGGMFDNQYSLKLFGALDSTIISYLVQNTITDLIINLAELYLVPDWYYYLNDFEVFAKGDVKEAVWGLVTSVGVGRSFMSGCYQVLGIKNQSVNAELNWNTLYTVISSLSYSTLKSAARKYIIKPYGFQSSSSGYGVKLLEYFLWPKAKLLSSSLAQKIIPASASLSPSYIGLTIGLGVLALAIYYYGIHTIKTVVSPTNLFSVFKSFSEKNQEADNEISVSVELRNGQLA